MYHVYLPIGLIYTTTPLEWFSPSHRDDFIFNIFLPNTFTALT